MRVFPVPALSDNYIWLVVDADQSTAVVVDPGLAGPVLEELQRRALRATAVILTHHHHDHCGGATKVSRHEDCPVFGPSTEGIQAVTRSVADGSKLVFGSMEFEVLAVPGHTAGHIAYFGSGILLCGDTLFAGGCGRVFEGTPGQMYRSLQRLAALPPETKVCCAHEYTLANLLFAQAVEPENPDLTVRLTETRRTRDLGRPTLPSTISQELATNPFLRCDRPEVIASAERHAGADLDSPTEVFATLRSWKDSF